VLRVHLTQGISAPPADTLDAALETIQIGRKYLPWPIVSPALTRRGLSRAPRIRKLCSATRRSPPGAIAFSAPRSANTSTARLIKWCEAFLDEGHATWPMPGREKGFYAAWKSLAQKEWSPCGIRNSREKLARLPAHAEDALLESLGALGVHPEAWQEYLSLHLAALPGWAGFIKWRADQSEYPNGNSPTRSIWYNISRFDCGTSANWCNKPAAIARRRRQRGGDLGGTATGGAAVLRPLLPATRPPIARI
jgi:hypothetical protein